MKKVKVQSVVNISIVDIGSIYNDYIYVKMLSSDYVFEGIFVKNRSLIGI